MLSKQNWDETKRKWDAYWRRENPGAPLMCIVAEKEVARDPALEAALRSRDMEDKYLNAARIVARFRYYVNTHEFLAESFPNISLDFGPGSMAAYLGSGITFRPDTVWFGECVEDWAKWPDLTFNPENEWFKRHIQLFRDVKALAGDDFYLTIPDIMENIDVIASLRGAQNTVYDLIDDPDEVKRRIVTGAYALSSTWGGGYYRKIKTAQQTLCRETDEILAGVDTVLLPTAAGAAFPLGSWAENPTAQYVSDRFTTIANLTGSPAIQFPGGGDGEMPVGLTLMGRKRSESVLLRAAFALEAELSETVRKEAGRYERI